MKLLTVNEAAEMLRVKPQWVYSKARAGLIPSLRLGRRLRIDEEALQRWLAARSAGPGGIEQTDTSHSTSLGRYCHEDLSFSAPGGGDGPGGCA